MDKDVVEQEGTLDVLFVTTNGAYFGVGGSKKLENRFAFSSTTGYFGLQFSGSVAMSAGQREYIPTDNVTVFPIGNTLLNRNISRS